MTKVKVQIRNITDKKGKRPVGQLHVPKYEMEQMKLDKGDVLDATVKRGVLRYKKEDKNVK